jgi:hypothetical protein
MNQLKRRICLYRTAAAHDSDTATGDGAQTPHYFFPCGSEKSKGSIRGVEVQPSAKGPPKQTHQQKRGMPEGLATNVATMPPAAPISGTSVAITRRAQLLRLRTSLRPNRARLDASLLSAGQTQREAQSILQRVEAAGIDPCKEFHLHHLLASRSAP